MPQSPAATPRLPGPISLVLAWTGGAAFVISLAVFVYAYVDRFGAAAGASHPEIRVAFDVALFSAFALHHSLFARARIKQTVLRVVPPWLERSVYTWVASLLFLAVCLLWQPVPGTVYVLHGGWRLAAYAVQLVAFALIARGSAVIDVLDLAGIRPVLDARSQSPPRHVPLETGGAYRLVRHPIYFGWALFVFGIPTMTVTRAVFAVVSTAYLVVAIPFEERSLVDVFGNEYRAYQGRTRWRMFPGIW